MTLKIVLTNPHYTLRQLGYKHRMPIDDYVRNDTNGRFHAKMEGKKAHIHYDLVINGEHVSGIPMPSHLQNEEARIRKFMNTNGRNK